MHILLIPSWYPKKPSDIGGSFFREQAQALYKNGSQVGVITLQLRIRGLRSIFTGKHNLVYENDEGVSTYQKHGVLWSPKLATWLWKTNVRRLFKHYVKQHGIPDIIHVHSMLYAGVAAKAISEEYQIPFIVTEHSSAFARGLWTKEQKHLIQQIAISAKRRFAVSESLAKLLLEFIGKNNSPWEVMPNIVHERFFHPLLKPKAKQLPFVFINIAMLTQKKGVDLLIKAFAKVLAIQPSLQLKIGGDGIERGHLVALSHKLGITSNIEFLGLLNRESVVEQIQTADALVLSSPYETFGVVVVEALALGKPVIATRCGGPEDIIREQDGFLVPVNDVEALATAMLHLYQDRDHYKPAKIRTACYERYSEQAVSKKLADVYQKILTERLI